MTGNQWPRPHSPSQPTGDPKSEGLRGLPAPVAVVVGGGGVLGAAHVGVGYALEQRGFVPDLVIGTSVGALTGAIAHHTEQTSVGSRKLADWDPAFCCEYNGVWTLAVDGQGDLWVGGQYTKVGTAWDPGRMIVDVTPKALGITTQRYIAELS